MKKFLLIILVCLLGATNMFAQTQGSLSGLFSVSATTKVRFSQGNLQYQASTNTWRFAENQYDYIGGGNKNASATYSGWIDLFTWGASGYSVKPYVRGTCYSGSDISGTKNDWGVYNAISNGGNKANMWRTLTHDEWVYLLNDRANAGNKKALVTVNSKHGLIILPDSWTLPTSCTFTAGIGSGWNTNVYTLEQFKRLEQAGAVFLPASGRYYSTSPDPLEFEQFGWYWSTTPKSNTTGSKIYNLGFHSTIIDPNNAGMSGNYAKSVRLVQNSTVSANYTLTTKVSPTDGGTVTEGGSVEYGTNKTIEATPNPDYQFVMWDDGSTDNPRSIVVTENATYTAIFEPTEQTSPNNSNGALNGLFSVSANKTVRFSMGNLQYQASTNTWRFAENQYDIIGKNNSNISSTYSGWIDLFGWGTSGYNGKNPYMTSRSSSDYYGVVGGSYADIAGTNYDWGVYNKISNGGNTAGQWRTLTRSEWNYVLNTRTDASALKGSATVNGVKGMILLPDNWTTPSGITFTSGMNGFYSNTYTTSDWVKMEANGAVFLPAAGYRDVSDLNYVGSRGFYGSSSAEYSDGNAYYLYFNSDDARMYYGSPVIGQSVRLVQNSTVSANYTLTTKVSPTEGGMVTEGGSFVYGTNKTIEATPNPDYQFVMWDDGSTDNPRSVVVTENVTYTASFSYVGHSYGVPTYVWNTDSTQCTATRICSNDVSHIETETATSSIDTTAATCINTGVVTYTVNFTNTVFTAQTVTKEIPVLGHDYNLKETIVELYGEGSVLLASVKNPMELTVPQYIAYITLQDAVKAAQSAITDNNTSDEEFAELIKQLQTAIDGFNEAMNPTAIGEIANELMISVKERTIYITNIQGEPCAVYDIAGKCVYACKDMMNAMIIVRVAGVYVVKIGNKQQNIVIND